MGHCSLALLFSTLILGSLAFTTQNPPAAGAQYLIGKQGDSCFNTCANARMNCNPAINTNNSAAIFQQLGISCTPDSRPWWAEDQPSYVSDPNDQNYNKCLGYTSVPGGVFCGASYPSVRRLCYCEPASFSGGSVFGNAWSGGYTSLNETVMFAHELAPMHTHGVITHIWSTAPDVFLNNVLVRIYVDGETTASIQFVLPMAAGAGFGDQTAPWGTQWMGKGAKNGAWNLNYRIPFQKRIKVTVQAMNPAGVTGGFYFIVRGAPDLPIRIGQFEVPAAKGAKMKLAVTQVTLQPLQWLPIINLTSGSGLIFMHSLAVQSGNLNFLEGCYHFFSPWNRPFPGVLLSSGTEDYFDSAWYFDAGEFRLPVAGYTHYAQVSNALTWSAYRLHDMDPLLFSKGVQYVWRNGDANDPAGQKCNMLTGGTTVGFPTESQVTAYAWYYLW